MVYFNVTEYSKMKYNRHEEEEQLHTWLEAIAAICPEGWNTVEVICVDRLRSDLSCFGALRTVRVGSTVPLKKSYAPL